MKTGFAADHSYLYSSRIEKTFDDDQADIISALKQEIAVHPKFQVRLINYRKGLPVSYPAQLIGIDRDTGDKVKDSLKELSHENENISVYP